MVLTLDIPDPYVYAGDTNLVIMVPVDAIAPKGARPSAGTVPTTKLDIYRLCFPGYQNSRSPLDHHLTTFKITD